MSAVLRTARSQGAFPLCKTQDYLAQGTEIGDACLSKMVICELPHKPAWVTRYKSSNTEHLAIFIMQLKDYFP